MFTAIFRFLKKHGLKSLIAIVPALLAIIRPGSTFTTANAQTFVTLGGLVVAGVMYLGDSLIANLKEYGLSKAALVKTVDEDETWVWEHAADIHTAFNNVQWAIGEIPGGPAAITDFKRVLDDVKGELTDLKSRVPAIDIEAIEALVKNYLDTHGLGASKPKVPVMADVLGAAQVASGVTNDPVASRLGTREKPSEAVPVPEPRPGC